jgi:chromate reductase, NAD(P)H dehydrogenase (quinone)
VSKSADCILANGIQHLATLVFGNQAPNLRSRQISRQEKIIMASPKILVLSGSSREGSVNTKLATVVAAKLKAAGATVTQISLADYPLPLADATGFGHAPKEAMALRELADSHHGLFIASPEYNAGYTPALKNALDWMSIAKPGAPALSGKIAAVGGASAGAMGGYRGMTQLRTVLELGFGAFVIPEMVAVGDAGNAFAEDGSLKDERTGGFLDALVARLVKESARAA